MKRIFSILLILSLLLTLSACGRKRREETGLLRVGVLEPLTGKYAEAGLRETLGIQYANSGKSTIRLNGRDYRIELVIKDNGSDAAQSAQCAQELVDEGCAVVLGSYGDELSAAASDVFLAAGVPAIAASGSDPALTQGNDHYFRVSALPDLQGGILAAFARKTLGAKSVYCLVQSGSETDAMLLRAFRKSAEALEMKVVTAEFPANSTDLTPYLTAAKEEGTGVIFAPCALQYAQRLIEQTDTTDGAPTFLADVRWRDPSLLRALAEKDIPVYVAAAYSEGVDSAFDKGFKAWLNDNSEAMVSNGGTDAVTPESVLAYDAYFTALGAVEMSGSADKADILAFLPRVTREGSAGRCSFDEDGTAQRSAMWVEKADAKNGVWTLAGKGKID